MNEKQAKQTRIKVKKINIRGDEVAILFFSVVFLIFLLFSFFRLFAIGKLFDDFVFTFLFGWSKYLVYLFLFIVVVPICFNRYFRFKFTLLIAIFLSIISVSWLVANISLIVQSQENIWLKFRAYDFDDLSIYFSQWWDSTIINNYYGFFADPLSFDSWTNVSSFFPNFAAGGVIAYALIATTNYGFFVTNFVLNLVVILIAFSWLLFSRPWLPFCLPFLFIKPCREYIKRKTDPRVREQIIKNKLLVHFHEEQKSRPENRAIVQDSFRKAEPKTSFVQIDKNREVKVSDEVLNDVQDERIQIDTNQPTSTASLKKEPTIHKVINESGNLTPFQPLEKDKQNNMNFIVGDDENEWEI